MGTGKTLNVSAYTVNDGNSGNNYSVGTVASAAGVINAAVLTYTANAAGMTYGSGVPGLSGTVSGFMGADNQGNATTGALTFTTGATSASSVGSYAINGSGLAANGGNYTFVQAAGNATALTINALPVILTGTRPYNATTEAAAVILAVANKVGSDNVTVASGSGTLAGANVGSEAITSFGTLNLGGTAAGNYTLAGASGSVDITVSAVALTVTNLVVLDRVYDGTTNATLDATNAGLAGVLNGDSVTLVTSNAAGYFTDKNVGTNKPVTVRGLGLVGTAAGNYTLADPTNVTANIAAAGLTVSGVTAATKVYDGTTNAQMNGPAILNGAVSGDNVSLVTGGVSAAFASSNVGTNLAVMVSGYAITGADAGNYTLADPTNVAANITAAPLTITAVANTKTYDGATNALAIPTVSGLQGSDTVTGLAESYATKNVGTGKTLNVSAYTVNDGNSGNNYSVGTVASAAGVINAAVLTYTANAAGMTYGSGVPGLSGTVSGFMGADNQGNATTGALTFTTGATSASSVGSYAINGSGLAANGGNYTFVQAAGNATALTINALPVILTGTRPYNATTEAAAVILAVANKVGSDNVTVASGSGTLAGANVGSEAITSFGTLNLGGTAAGNYTLAGASGSVDITVSAVALTVTNLVVLDRVYDGTTNATLDATNAGLAGVLNGDSVTLVTSNAAGYFTDKNVGTNKPVTVRGLGLVGTAAGNYTLADPTNVTANIAAAGLTVSGVTAATKVYDGTTNAQMNGPAILNGAVSGDNVSLVTGGVSAAFASSNVGTNLAVMVSGYAITGADAGNYTLADPTNVAANITAAPLTITAVANTKTYDGATNALAIPTVSGLQGSDTVTGLAESYATKNVGTGKTLNVSAYTVNDGNSGNNYSVGTVASAAGVINAAVLTYTANAAGMTYGSGVPGLSGTVSGFMGADNQGNATTGALTFTTGATSASSVGSYAINGSGLAANGGNYTFVQAAGNATALTINALPVILTGTRPYNATTEAAAVILAVANKVGSDNVTVASGSGTLAGANVGSEAITSFGTLNLGGTAAGNYTLAGASGSVDITVSAVALTVTNLVVLDRVYDGTTNATLDATNAGLAGVLNGDSVTLVTSNAAGYFTDKNVGTNKPVTVRGLGLVGTAAGNYTLADPTNVTANIAAKALTVTSVPAPVITLIRLTNGVVAITWDSAAGGIYRVQYIDSLNGTGWSDLLPDVTATGLTTTQTNVVGGAPQRFYRIKLFNSGITANNKAYDGTTTATISSNNVVLNGVLAGDATDVGLSTNGYVANFARAGVGNGIGVTVSGLTLVGAGASNYTLTPPVGLAANITAVRVTITSGITANTKAYDGTTAATISSNNVVLNGVLAGDATDVGLSTNGYVANFARAGVGNGIGVTVSGLTLVGAGATNYTLVQPVGLTANITPATLTVSATGKKKRTYGLPNSLAISYNGFVHGEGTNVLTGAPSLSTSATINSPPGTYPITIGPGTLSAANYTFIFNGGTLTVMASPQLSGVALNGNQFVFNMPTVASQTYQIEYKDNLTAATWSLSGGPIVGTGNPIIITNGLGASPQRFFRLRISP